MPVRKIYSLTHIGLLFIFPVVFTSFVYGQTPPNNLSLDEENHIMKLEGLNTSSFYDEDILESVYLEFDQPDYWQQLHDCYDTENYVLGTLRYNGEVLDSIGAQFKGNTSYTKVSGEKYSIAIALDEYIGGQDIDAYNTLNFNNAHMDASLMKEVLYNHMNRSNIPSAKANFIKLYINGEYWGIYDNVQQLNKDFTKEWFMTNNGSLWRGVAPSGDEGISKTSTAVDERKPPGGGPNWGDGTTALNFLGADTALYQERYTLKHSSQDNPWDLLLNLTDVLNNTPEAELLEAVSQYLDIDKTLWFLAHETIFTDDDSYIMKGRQDYYIYYEPETQLITPLEFDGNSALDTRNIAWDMFYNEEKVNYPLMNRLYAIPEVRQRYLAHARAIIEELLDVQLTDSLIEKYDDLISSSVELDTKSAYSFNEYKTSIAELKGYFTARKDILLANSEVSEVGLTITSVEHITNGVLFASPAHLEPANITATITGSKGVDKTYLYYSSYYVGSFIKTEMLDDGLHNDGTAGDGIYGAEIPGFSNGEYVRYYIESIADDAAKTASYSPLGAEHDVYYYRVGVPVTVNSELVINELCASNSSLVADNEGEYDDWIELYNNAAEAVSLAGYFMTDDLAELTKWALPDLRIDGNSYLTIWADNDETQGEDHASFKLSASGEEVYLITPNLEIADHVSFGMLETDASYGRFPNGTGPFEGLDPTYNSENKVYSDADITSLIDTEALHVRLYPNPASNYVTVETTGDEDLSFCLYNLQGILLTKETIHNTTTIEISHLNKGLYIVQIEGASNRYATKLIIE